MVRFLLTSLLLLATTSPAVARADEAPILDLVGSASTTVVVAPDEGAVVVTHDYRFVNPTNDDAFTGFFETLPWDATDVVATSGGVELPAVGIPARDGFSEWLVRFPQPLDPGAEREVMLTWRREAAAGDPNDLDHVSELIVAIAPYAVEHRGNTSLRIEIPGGYEVIEAGDLVIEQVDDHIVLEAVDAVGYEPVPVVLEAPARFTRATTDGTAGEVVIATADPLSTWLTDDLEVVLAGLRVAIPLDPPGPVEFRQGYTGGEASRLADDGALVLPFDADAAVAARVYADAWLATIDFADDELRTALSSALADSVAADAGLAVPPRAGEWTAALDALVSVSDDSARSTVIAALEAGVPAYVGVDDEFSDVAVDWRRLVDVFQHVAGVQAAPAAMRLSADGEQLIELDRRDAALVDYDALAARAAPWAMPPMLRDPMAAWDFDLMAQRQGSVSDLVIARDEMVAAAESVELEIGPYVQAEFEQSVVDADGAWTLLVAQREALEHVAEAVRLDVGDRGLLSSLGMWGRDADATIDHIVDDWNAGEFEAAAHEAEALIEDYEGSVGRGTLRLVAPLAALSVLGLGVQALVRRRAARVATRQP